MIISENQCIAVELRAIIRDLEDCLGALKGIFAEHACSDPWPLQEYIQDLKFDAIQLESEDEDPNDLGPDYDSEYDRRKHDDE